MTTKAQNKRQNLKTNNKRIGIHIILKYRNKTKCLDFNLKKQWQNKLKTHFENCSKKKKKNY